jgi:hypothetical protein
MSLPGTQSLVSFSSVLFTWKDFFGKPLSQDIAFVSLDRATKSYAEIIMVIINPFYPDG